MTFQNGEIDVSPYTVYWVQMPVSIGENDRIELLKKDIFVIECNYQFDEYKSLIEKNEINSAFFFNLDKIFATTRGGNEYDIAVRLAKFIAGLCPDKSVVHTTILDDKMKKIFQTEGLIYIEKNFNDKEGAVNIVMNLLKPLFSHENQMRRTSVRIKIYPGIKYKVELVTTDQKNFKIGFLKDISLSGLGIIMLDDGDLDYFSLKDQVQLKIFTQSSILKIPIALVTRRNKDLKEIGVNYNINDNNMIKDETSTFLTKIIYKWIKEVIDNYGKI